MVFKKV